MISTSAILPFKNPARFSASSLPTRRTPRCRWITTQSRPQMFQTQPPRTLRWMPQPSRRVVRPTSTAVMSS